MNVSPAVREQFKNLTNGVPGAVRVCIDLLNLYGEKALEMLEVQNIRDRDIWFLYKDVCGENYSTMYDALLEGNALEQIKKHPHYR